MKNTKTTTLLKTILKAAQDLKGENISVMNLSTVSSYADFVFIVSANSDRQIRAICDRMVETAFKKCKVHPLGIEGFEAGVWVLVDFGDIICHIFSNEVRQIYHLEDMWPRVKALNESDAEKLFTAKKTETKPKAKTKTTAKKVTRKKKGL